MLRFPGFLTGCGLTVLLASAVLEPAGLDALRRSAMALVAGGEPVGAGARQATSGEAAGEPVVPASAPATAAAGSVVPATAAPDENRADAGTPIAAVPPDHPGTAGGPAGTDGVAGDEEPPRDAGPGQAARRRESARDVAPAGAGGSAQEQAGGPGKTAPDPNTGSPVGPAGVVDPAPSTGAWHAFWTPFHSEASATGFARHLEQVTGVPHRVVRTGPAAYRVAFWHDGEDARSRQLLAIERASGLSLRGGEL
jgi:hypothetical protein